METLADDSGRSKHDKLELTDGVGESKSVEGKESADLGSGGESQNEELGEDEEDDMEEEEEDQGEEEGRVFSDGEFVWGKIKHHPWWPGQIYDAYEASELALKHKPKDKDLYLVAYFGDGTFSWCSGSQLKSFGENFASLSQQCNLKSFQSAVEDALSVIGELVVLEMTCACTLKNGQVGFDRRVAENAGVRKGVLVPMIGVDRLAATRFDAASIVASVRNAARSVSLKNSLELTLLKSKLLAFYSAKGHSDLPKYRFPVYIVGLEDINKSDVAAEAAVDGLVSDEDGQTPSANPSEKTSSTLQEDKLYGRRKQKSLADIIREETDTDVQNDKEDKETPPRRRQGTRRRKRVGHTDSEEKGSFSSLVKGRKKTKSSQKANSTEDIKVRKTEATSVDIDDNDRHDNVKVDVAVRSKGRKRIDTTGGEKDRAAKSGDKKRKKESPFASIKQVGFEPVLLDLHTDARVGERMSKAAKLIIESPPIRKQHNIISDIEPAQNCTIKDEGDQAKRQVQGEMLNGIKPAAVSPLHEKPSGSKLDVYSASNYDTLVDEDDGRPMSAILFLTFPDGVSLPSKADLLAKYRRFGSLNEEETDVLPNSLCAQVVFIKKSEGEQAFEDMLKVSSADSGVQHRIRYVPRKQTSPQSGKVNNDAQRPVCVSYLKQKFEVVMSKLNEAEGEALTNDLKNELHRELTNLLEKLSRDL